MQNIQQNYIDFNSFEIMSLNENVMNKLVQSYQDIFSDPLLWSEQYSEEEVKNSLQVDLSGDANIRLCMNNAELLGFFWAQRLNAKAVIKAIKRVKYYQALGSPALAPVIHSIIGDTSVIYLHDLGIASQYRGQVSLHHLIRPVLNSLTQRTQTRRIFFWSIENTRVYKLAQRAGFELAATLYGMQFFTGELTSSNNTVIYNS